MKVKVENLVVWKFADFCEYFDVSDDKEDYNEGVRVLKIECGSRGEEEIIEDVEIVNGEFEVRSEDDIRDYLKGEIEEWWNEENWDEFVSSGIEEWYAIDGVNMNVYGENVFEELGFLYVRVEV